MTCGEAYQYFSTVDVIKKLYLHTKYTQYMAFIHDLATWK